MRRMGNNLFERNPMSAKFLRWSRNLEFREKIDNGENSEMPHGKGGAAYSNNGFSWISRLFKI